MPENPDTFPPNIVGIPSSQKRIITNNIDFYKYDENYVADQDKWGVDSGGGVGPFFGEIAYEKEFGNSRDNHVSIEG